jgi:hypothetical protein
VRRILHLVNKYFFKECFSHKKEASTLLLIYGNKGRSYMIRETTHGNALISALTTKYLLLFISSSFLVFEYPLPYMHCSCTVSSTCIESSKIVQYSGHPTLYTIPSFYVGCYVIKSLLHSTLQCFYDHYQVNIL